MPAPLLLKRQYDRTLGAALRRVPAPVTGGAAGADVVWLGLSRIVVSVIEAPILLVNPV